jgi:undecaprenyl diphosphate synthase
VDIVTRLRALRRLKPVPEPERPATVRSVAIIMDGNARWARRRHLPVIAGHDAGTRALHRTIDGALELGIESLCVFAFSTENWSRPQDEVEALMELFVDAVKRELPHLVRNGVRARFVGRRDRAPEQVRETMDGLEAATVGGARMQLWVAFDYGGRAELVDAARRLVDDGIDPRDVDENAVASRLYAPEMPDPDLFIRTSGELRMSNFLLWQAAYSELVFVDTLWPDFGERDLRRAVEEYATRRRRFGGR